jgi:AcrR family transcriptional regulator
VADPAPARSDLEPTRAGLEGTREGLLESAARLFAEGGYHRTTVEDVVAAAGVAKGTVYWYYPSKKALFLAVLQRSADVYRDGLVDAASSAGSRVGQLERAIDATLEYARQRPDLCRLYFQQVLLDDPDFVSRRAAIHARLVADLKRTIRDAIAAAEIPDQDVDLAAHMIVGAVEAVVRQILDGGSRRSAHQAGAQLRAFVAAGLRRGAGRDGHGRGAGRDGHDRGAALKGQRGRKARARVG